MSFWNIFSKIQTIFVPKKSNIYLSQFLAPTNALIKHNFLNTTFNNFLLKHLFEEFADSYSRQEILGSLVTHVGSAVSFEVSSAQQIMASLATKHARELIPLSSHINGILDYLEGLTVESLYKVYEVFSHMTLLARSNVDCLSSSMANELFIIVRRQVSHPDLKYKKMGLIGILKIVSCLGGESNATLSSQFEVGPRISVSPYLSKISESGFANPITFVAIDDLAKKSKENKRQSENFSVSGRLLKETLSPTDEMVSGAAAVDSTRNATAGITRLIRGLDSLETREQSLDILCKNRHTCENLAILLWNSFGTMKVLLEVITSAYRPLLSDTITDKAVTQVCNAIALLQPVASHPDTKMAFVRATMPVYLYPFLNTMSSERNYECLRLTSLGVIGSLAKVDDPDVVEYLLSTQIFPSCLRCLEFGRTLSKTVATFIIYRILLNEKGLKYCFILAERYLAVSQCLAKVIESLGEEDDENLPRLLRNIIGCYLRLSENQRTRQQLSSYVPWKLMEYKYVNILQGDPESLGNLRRLIHNLKFTHSPATRSTSQSQGPFIR
ncbi:uncharacterized protein LOC120153327 [Hibiscus syriacus]|uniref:uncharacterized protein LOC120153327 n=1 Tax=Hibiscus syriacus TaxID=106335 RepID=UPI00192139FA|nr:uncharacterized protein LOC120153327 [Hibiscus syriacus]